MPKQPIRAIRISDEIWHAAQGRAAAEGRSVSSVVVEALRRYGKKKPA
jgi:predicted HicB family RNase H-like nuclease